MSMVVKLRLSLFEDGKGPKLVTSDLTPGYKLVIGRGEGVQLWVNDKNISRAHCQMIYDDSGQLFVEDLKSRNGTFVNGERIEETQLRSGDHIQVGQITFVLEVGVAAEPKVPETPAAKPAESRPAQPVNQISDDDFFATLGNIEDLKSGSATEFPIEP